jgi:hypothetical protein
MEHKLVWYQAANHRTIYSNLTGERMRFDPALAAQELFTKLGHMRTRKRSLERNPLN